MKRKVLIIGALLILVCAAFALSRPVLFRSPFTDASCGESTFVVLNPFRDRSVENYVDPVLALMRDKACEQVVRKMELPQDRREYICEKQKEHPLVSWQLKDRRDEGQRSNLFYHIRYKGSDNVGWLWLSVEKRDGELQVTHYSTIY